MNTKITRRGLGRIAVAGLAGTAMVASGILPSWAQDKPRYAMLVRVLGNTAFELAHVGAQEAADEEGVEPYLHRPNGKYRRGSDRLDQFARRPARRCVDPVRQ
ncbi:hypothetical protein PSQ19_07575 [Devosia algicola]|uniref:Uncharacterized protein n=1 Tax=Devosia algicola TaxID=3026418 RepID=A0ABY7YRP0_9HYPH|nr:hypothetical protein [Devosia algicola]WDR03882.1 hypothetical protein PSQ19_07575 [Devosia algicola]